VELGGKIDLLLVSELAVAVGNGFYVWVVVIAVIVNGRSMLHVFDIITVFYYY
jgi:hypothetical protein